MFIVYESHVWKDRDPEDCFLRPIYVGRIDVVVEHEKRKYFLVESIKKDCFAKPVYERTEVRLLNMLRV